MMNQKIKILSLLLSLFFLNSLGQIDQFQYKRELKGIKENWHKIILPEDIFGKIKNDYNDIRIVGVTDKNDTIEAPYLLRINSKKISESEVEFKILNTSNNPKGYFFTFKIPQKDPVNLITLNFEQKNFDWNLKLEGSFDQAEWFTILEDYRIMSIKNNLTDFKFTKINLPQSEYMYYRVFIESKEKPLLLQAKVLLNTITEGNYNRYNIKELKYSNDKKNKQTEILIDLKTPVPVSSIKIIAREKWDYYRPISIDYLSDSFKTENGWRHVYSHLTSGIVTSFDKNEFVLKSTILKKLKVTILNHDNQPITIDSIIVKGYKHELIARFTEPAKYFLIYGNNTAEKAHYDIAQFSDKIPESPSELALGDEHKFSTKEIKKDQLLDSKPLLWLIMTLVILVLGWFSLKMIKKNS